MKKHLLTLAGLCSLSLTAGALEIPRSVHRASEITKASAEAATSKRGILWVLTDSTLKPG